MVESIEFPHLANKYRVQGVPRTVINETTAIEGGTGDTYTVSDSDANLTTTAVTTAAEAEDVYFGRAMISSGFASTEGYRYGRMAKSTAFSAQVATFDYTYDADEIIRIRCRNVATGEIIAEADHVMATSKDAAYNEPYNVPDGPRPPSFIAVRARPTDGENGGIEVRCFCTTVNPHSSTKQQGGTVKICDCESTTVTEAGVYNRVEK